MEDIFSILVVRTIGLFAVIMLLLKANVEIFTKIWYNRRKSNLGFEYNCTGGIDR